MISSEENDIARFVRNPCAEYATALLTSVHLVHHSFIEIAEACLTLITISHTNDAILALTLLLELQTRGFILEYINTVHSSLTDILVQNTLEFVKSEYARRIFDAVLQVTHWQTMQIINSAQIWIRSLLRVSEDESIFDWSLVNAEIAEFVTHLIVLGDLPVPWSQECVSETMVFVALNLFAHRCDSLESETLSDTMKGDILTMPRKNLLKFSTVLGQIVRSPQWLSAEVFLCYFTSLVVTSRQIDDEMRFLILSELQELLWDLANQQHSVAFDTRLHQRLLDQLSERPRIHPTFQQQYLAKLLDVPARFQLNCSNEEWMSILGALDVGRLYGFVRNELDFYAASDFTHESGLTSLYSLLRSFVERDFHCFNPLWIERAAKISKTREDALLAFADLMSIYLRSEKDLQSCQAFFCRAKEPGLARLKITVSRMLQASFLDLDKVAVWSILLSLTLDPDKKVCDAAELASLNCLRQANSWQSLVHLLKGKKALAPVIRLSRVLGEPQDPALANLRLVVYELLQSEMLDYAVQIVRANGQAMPVDWLKHLKERGLQKTVLRLLASALRDLSVYSFPPTEISLAFNFILHNFIGTADPELHHLAGDALLSLVEYPDLQQTVRKAQLYRVFEKCTTILRAPASEKTVMAIRVAGYMGSFRDWSRIPAVIQALPAFLYDKKLQDAACLSLIEIGIFGWDVNMTELQNLVAKVPAQQLWCSYCRIHDSTVKLAFLSTVSTASSQLIAQDFTDRAAIHLLTAGLHGGTLVPDPVVQLAIQAYASLQAEEEARMAMEILQIAEKKYRNTFLLHFLPALAIEFKFERVVTIWTLLARNSLETSKKLIKDVFRQIHTSADTTARWISVFYLLPLGAAETALLIRYTDRLRRSLVEPVPHALLLLFRAWMKTRPSSRKPLQNPVKLAAYLAEHPAKAREIIDALESLSSDSPRGLHLNSR